MEANDAGTANTARTLPLRIPHREAPLTVTGSADDRGIMDALEHTGGTYEPHVMEALRRLVSEEALCVDVGANIGLISLALASYAPRGRVAAFEASPATFEFLQKNVLLNRATNLQPVAFAASDENTTLTFGHLKHEPGNSFVYEGSAGGKQVDLVEVKAVRLDDWLTENGYADVSVIKIDVEGAERRVLRGAAGTIQRAKPDCVIEFFPGCMEVLHGEDPHRTYELLRELYPRIYAIADHPVGNLVEVTGYSELAAWTQRTKGIVDLLCTHRAPEEMARLFRIVRNEPGFTCTGVNVHPDGWTRGRYAELLCVAHQPGSRPLVLARAAPGLPAAKVTVACGDWVRVKTVEANEEWTVEVPFTAGLNTLFVDAGRTFTPAGMGLSPDSRELGVRVGFADGTYVLPGLVHLSTLMAAELPALQRAASPDVAEAPLRHRVVDALNDWTKGHLGPVHRAAKRLSSRLLRSRKG